MDFDEHEEQEEEEEIGNQPPQPNYGNSGREKMGGGEGDPSRGCGGGGYRYRECLKNHAVSIGGHAVDGCGEFMAAGEEGTLDALKCAACNCHRNFHRKETEGEGFHHHHHQFPIYSYHHHRTATAHPTGYLHLTPPPPHHNQRPPLALPSTSRDDEDVSNQPSSSGGGRSGSGSKSRRFRTKFTQEQKDKMLAFAERLGWRIQKHDESDVQQFCAEIGINRHVLKVWMHNNKHTLGKKP